MNFVLQAEKLWELKPNCTGVRGEADDRGTLRKKMRVPDMENILNFGLEDPAASQVCGGPLIDLVAMDMLCWLLQD